MVMSAPRKIRGLSSLAGLDETAPPQKGQAASSRT
jgi:hypothetical protein